MPSQDKEKLLDQLEALKIFPKNKLVQALRKQILSNLGKLERKKKVVENKEEIKIKAKLSKSSKLRKYHGYLRLIRDNFPDLNYNTIRKQFSERKKGNDVSIPDVIWQNPSP